MALPSQADIDLFGYGHDPYPMVPILPIAATTFFHHLAKPEDHPQRVWCARMPKKLHKSILQWSGDPDTLVVGWGVHIIEGIHQFNMLLTMLVLLCLTAAVSITWAVVRDDVQGGYGIGAFLVAAQTLVLMMVDRQMGRLVTVVHANIVRRLDSNSQPAGSTGSYHWMVFFGTALSFQLAQRRVSAAIGEPTTN
jgi:hypothetical protein